MIVSIGSLIGFIRIRSHLVEKNNFLKLIIPISFGVFWFSVMWLVFFFVLQFQMVTLITLIQTHMLQ